MNDKKTILLVEDEALIAMVQKKTLERHGYEVITVTTGEKAIEKVRTAAGIDIILMDINLGNGMDGTEAAGRILSVRPVPIVFLTSHAEKEYVDRVRKITRYGYVIKGSGDFVLQSSIEMAFELFNAHEKTRMSEERYRRITEGLTDYLYTVRVKDCQAVETTHSEACLSVTGYRSEEFAANPYLWLDMVVPEDRQLVIDHAQGILSGKQISPFEHRIIRKDGQIRLMSHTPIVQIDSLGNTISYDGVVKDITDRNLTEEDLRIHRVELEAQNEELRHTQEELEASRTRYFDFYDLAPVGYLTLSERGLILEANLTTAALLGEVTRKALVKQPISRFILPEDQGIYYLKRKQLFETASAQMWEMRMLRKDKTTFWAQVQAIAAQDADGSPACRIVISDITERKKAEYTAYISELRYRRLFETTQDGILLIDFDTGMILDVNTFLIDLLGYSKDDFFKKHLWEVGVFRDVAASKDNFVTLQKKRYVRFEGLPLETKSGKKIDVEFVANVHEAGGTTVIQCNIRDTTERKLAEDKLRSVRVELELSNKDLEQFASIAAHDLQEPLRMVASYTQLLAERYEGQLDEKANKYIAYAVDGAIRMQQLVNDLLTYSRVGTRSNPIETADSHSILGEAIRNLAAMIEESKAIVTNEELPMVRADGLQLVQVFQNLLANAIKFRGEHFPLVHVSARDGGIEWVFSIRDNGIGIDRQYADRIFAIFQRLHTRQEYPGTGIGLAVCKRILERHGGRIWFESEIGKGSTFFFTVPK